MSSLLDNNLPYLSLYQKMCLKFILELSNLSLDAIKNLSIPFDNDEGRLSQCKMYDVNYTDVLQVTLLQLKYCSLSLNKNS